MSIKEIIKIPNPFLKVVAKPVIDIDENIAFWFRYTLLNGKKKEANTWAILFKNNKVMKFHKVTTE